MLFTYKVIYLYIYLFVLFFYNLCSSWILGMYVISQPSFSKQLMWSVCEDPHNLDTPSLLQEYLVGETYAAVHKHIDSDASHLLSLLPITTAPFTTDTEYIVSNTECR